MKKIIFLFAFLCSLNASYSQSKIGVTLGSIYGGPDGLILEAGINLQLHSKLDMNLALNSNFRFSKGFRTNINYTYFSQGKFSASAGLGYVNEQFDLSEFNVVDRRDHNLEIPLRIKYGLSNKLNINAAFIPSINMNGTRSSSINYRARLGLEYRF